MAPRGCRVRCVSTRGRSKTLRQGGFEDEDDDEYEHDLVPRTHADTPSRPNADTISVPNLHLFSCTLFLVWPSCGLRFNIVFMNLEEDVEVVCPYCGAIFTAFVDTSAGGYATIEDCQVCCRPIELIVGCHAGVIDQV